MLCRSFRAVLRKVSCMFCCAGFASILPISFFQVRYCAMNLGKTLAAVLRLWASTIRPNPALFNFLLNNILNSRFSHLQLSLPRLTSQERSLEPNPTAHRLHHKFSDAVSLAAFCWWSSVARPALLL